MKKIILLLSVLFFFVAVNAQKDTVKYRAVLRPVTNLHLQLDSAIEFVPVTVGPYCPKILLGGDREFGGHGPEIWANIKLSIVGGDKLVATVYLHARETESDWSETEGTWTKTLYKAPKGFAISAINSGKYSEVHYTSKPGMSGFSPGALRELVSGARGSEVTPSKDDGLVTRWNIVGDTMGDDISTDDDPRDDTQVAIQLNPVKLTLKRK